MAFGQMCETFAYDCKWHIYNPELFSPIHLHALLFSLMVLLTHEDQDNPIEQRKTKDFSSEITFSQLHCSFASLCSKIWKPNWKC